MKNSRVTIVIPTFNRKEFLERCINSCISQTYACEIIVCDHGSIDGTPDFMNKYKDKVTYIRRERDFGPHFCWLEGVLNASGEFIHLQFDDDWIEDTFIERTVSLMSDDVGFAATNAVLYNKNKRLKVINPLSMYNKTGIFSKRKLEKSILFRESVISPGCCLFRKDILIDSLYQGSLPLKETCDYHGVGPDMFATLLSFLKYKKIGVVNENLAVFRVHNGSITIDSLSDSIKKKKIKKAYSSVMNYYRFLKLYQPLHVVLKYISQIKFSLVVFFKYFRN